jgi:hypothetical protein
VLRHIAKWLASGLPLEPQLSVHYQSQSWGGWTRPLKIDSG